MPLWPGSSTVTLIPSCENSTGGSPYSLSNQHAAPLVSEDHHSASRTLTTNHPSVTGASPEPKSSSRASATNRILAARSGVVAGGGSTRVPDDFPEMAVEITEVAGIDPPRSFVWGCDGRAGGLCFP